jgi:hypothetical protein
VCTEDDDRGVDVMLAGSVSVLSSSSCIQRAVFLALEEVDVDLNKPIGGRLEDRQAIGGDRVGGLSSLQ